MGKSVGASAWSRASPRWESAERPENDRPLLEHFPRGGVATRRHNRHDRRSPLTEDSISLTTAGSNPIAWQAGQAQLPLRRHPENTIEPAAESFGIGTDDHEAELTQKRMWGDRSAVGQSTAWDAGRDPRANGQLVDAYG